MNILIIVCSLIFISINLNAEEKESKERVGIDEKLDEYIPDDILITNSKNELVNFKEIINKPTVIAFVYYNCPGICSPLLDGYRDVIDKSDMEPGKDYNAYTISFDPNENVNDSRKWKKNYIASLNKEINSDGWEFFTGDSLNIRKLTDAVGFYYIPQGDKDYLHPAALIVISPEGKITRYHNGTEFLPFNFKMSIIEAGRGKSQPTINKILDLCFKYEAEGRRYAVNWLPMFAVLILLSLGGFILYLYITTKRDKKLKENN